MVQPSNTTEQHINEKCYLLLLDLQLISVEFKKLMELYEFLEIAGNLKLFPKDVDYNIYYYAMKRCYEAIERNIEVSEDDFQTVKENLIMVLKSQWKEINYSIISYYHLLYKLEATYDINIDDVHNLVKNIDAFNVYTQRIHDEPRMISYDSIMDDEYIKNFSLNLYSVYNNRIEKLVEYINFRMKSFHLLFDKFSKRDLYSNVRLYMNCLLYGKVYILLSSKLLKGYLKEDNKVNVMVSDGEDIIKDFHDVIFEVKTTYKDLTEIMTISDFNIFIDTLRNIKVTGKSKRIIDVLLLNLNN